MMQRMEQKLDALWAEYRSALPDPEAGPGFMPGLWKRIEARRASNLVIFRRLAQVCVGATLALSFVMALVVIPRIEKSSVYATTYADVLVADHPNTYVDIFNGEIK